MRRRGRNVHAHAQASRACVLAGWDEKRDGDKAGDRGRESLRGMGSDSRVGVRRRRDTGMRRYERDEGGKGG